MYRIAIYAPLMDMATVLSYRYLRQLKSEIEGMGYPVIFEGTFKAIRPFLKRDSKDPLLLIYGGHALEDRLIGQIFFYSLLNKNNASMLKDSICIIIPGCLNGQELAQAAIDNGVRTWIGSDYWMYAAYPEREHNYLDDFYAHWAIIPLSIIDGKTAGEAFAHYTQIGHQLEQQYMQQFNAGKWDSGDMYAELVNLNTRRLKLFGDSSASL